MLINLSAFDNSEVNPRNVNSVFSAANLRSIYLCRISKKKSCGVDGMSATVFGEQLDAQIRRMSRKVLNGRYKPSPYSELQVSKGRGKAPRILSIPTVRDQVVLSALKEHLHAKFPECIGRKLPNSYVYELMSRIRGPLAGGSGYGFVRTDITGFYDNIDRERLMNYVRRKNMSRSALKLLYSAITKPTVPRSTVRKQQFRYFMPKGIPQGLSISNILANIYLADLDATMQSKSILYLRYVDDILVICPVAEITKVMEHLRFRMARLGLTLNDDKTETGLLDRDSFDFLGYKVACGAVSVRQTSIDRLIHSFAKIITAADHRSAEFLKRHKELDAATYRNVLIEDLNEKITGAISASRRYGWLYYFSQIDDVSLLHRLDRVVGELCKRSSVLNNIKPASLKLFVRAFREMHASRKGVASGYLLNYDEWGRRRKFDFIKYRGEWPGEKQYTN